MRGLDRAVGKYCPFGSTGCYQKSCVIPNRQSGGFLPRSAHTFEVGAGGLVSLAKRSRFLVRHHAAEAAGLAVEVGPPVAVLGEALFTEAVPIDEDPVPAGVAVGGRFL